MVTLFQREAERHITRRGDGGGRMATAAMSVYRQEP